MLLFLLISGCADTVIRPAPIKVTAHIPIECGHSFPLTPMDFEDAPWYVLPPLVFWLDEELISILLQPYEKGISKGGPLRHLDPIKEEALWCSTTEGYESLSIMTDQIIRFQIESNAELTRFKECIRKFNKDAAKHREELQNELNSNVETTEKGGFARIWPFGKDN